MMDDLDNVNFISSNVNSSRHEALLYVFEDKKSSDHDDREKKKSDNKTCFQDPHSCFCLTFRQN